MSQKVDNLQGQLERDEGLRLFPYVDTAGKLTIGFGRNLTNVGISAAEARVLLTNDIAIAEQAVAHALPWAAQLDVVRRAVLVNMAFNLGIASLSKFGTFLTYLKLEKWDAAADDMLATLWAREVGARAERLAMQLRTGEWQ
jgi:lysozyme